jgi:outer membrane receptor protein involved in Fe transport
MHRTNKHAHRSPLSIAIIAALALSAAAPALATETDAAKADATAQAATDAPAEAEAPKTAKLKSVIVTANKREEDIRTVSASISAIGQEEIENLHVTQLSDLSARVPGLYVNGGGSPGKTQVSLRGLQPLSSGATVGMYIDQAPLGSSGIYQAANFFSLDLLPYDIERIEVLRGPQGTLYGAGAMGGLIKYVTVAPDPTTKEFRIGGGLSNVSHSSESGWNMRLGGNVPLSESTALRFSYARNDLPGYIDNSLTGEEDINDGLQTSMRAALRWQNDAATFDLVAMRQTIDSDNNAQMALDPVSLDPQDGDLSNSVFVDEAYDKDVDFFSATLDWNLGWANFVSATSWSDSNSAWRQDGTLIYGEFANLVLGLPAPGTAPFDIGLDLNKFTQEFRLASNGDGPFQWMAGFFYTKEDAEQTQTLTLAELDGSPMPEPYNTLFGTLAVFEIPSEYRETAFFANGSYKFNDVFSLDAGIRYAQNDQEFSQNVTEGVLAPIGESPGASDENVFTWSIGPKFQLSDNLMLYGRIATGYQPGGPNVVVEGLPAGVDSSMLTNYEIGLRSQSDDRRFLFDATGFYMDWSDIQVATVVNGISGLVNAGTASSKGIELSGSFRATDRFTLGLNAAYTDAQLDEDYPVISVSAGALHQEITNGVKGDVLPYVPKWSWAGTADYDLPLSGGWMAHFGGAVRFVGDRKNTTTNVTEIFLDTTTPPTLLLSTVTEPVVVDSYWALDLNAYLANEHWTLRAYARNVTDERGFQTLGDITSAVTGATAKMIAAPIQPRTFGFEVDYSF